jgi:predicted dithiol-disulfide oxidoreductase (DUF899 family)
MSDSTVNAIHDVRFPNESAEYRAARDKLLEAEMALRRQTEAVAALRRDLPPGGPIPEDYVFQEGDDARPTRLSELFGDKSVLLLYSYMYGPAMAQPCPACTSILDSLDGAAPHIGQRAAIAAVARSSIARFRNFARERGWNRLRLLSSSENSYHQDYRGEDERGAQRPILNVFVRAADGAIRHSYATELLFAPQEPGQHSRHVDAIWPLWGALDLSPEGRGANTHPKLSYEGV